MPAVNYLWDPDEDNIVKEFDDAGNTIADYTTEPFLYGDVISQRRSGVSHFYHFDAQGNTTELTDINGNTTDTRRYSAFGEITEGTGSTTFAFQFIGQKGYYRDALTGQYSTRLDIYEPTRARWASSVRSTLLLSFYSVSRSLSFTLALQHESSEEVETPADDRATWEAYRGCSDDQRRCLEFLIGRIEVEIAEKKAAGKSCISSNPPPNLPTKFPTVPDVLAKCTTCRSQLDHCILDTLKGTRIFCNPGTDCDDERGLQSKATGKCILAKDNGLFAKKPSDKFWDDTCKACSPELLSASYITLCTGRIGLLDDVTATQCVSNAGIISALIHEALHLCLGGNANHSTNADYLKLGREGIYGLITEFNTTCPMRPP